MTQNNRRKSLIFGDFHAAETAGFEPACPGMANAFRVRPVMTASIRLQILDSDIDCQKILSYYNTVFVICKQRKTRNIFFILCSKNSHTILKKDVEKSKILK